MNQALSGKVRKILFSFFLTVSLVCALWPADEKKKDEEKTPAITESVMVIGKVPKEQPLATTSTITREKIEQTAARDVTEVLSLTAGTHVSSGSKNEWGIKVRGIDQTRMTLLYDGIPVYEPYFNNFDLKSFTAEDVDTIHVIKGASSVLYGPNTLGGIVDILSRRPVPPSLNLKASYGSSNTFVLSGEGSAKWRKFIFLGSALYEDSDGFRYATPEGLSERKNSDYNRTNLTGKVYFYPNEKSEILGEVTYLDAAYGVPTSLSSFNKSNYWRFPDWNRLGLNLGGSFTLGEKGNLKARLYYVKHYNVLDAYTNSSFTAKQWTSTYDNHSFGAFMLGTLPLSERHTLRTSLNVRSDDVRQQGDLGDPWENYEQQVYSLGAEDEFRLSDSWSVSGGLSVDYLHKQRDMGNDKTRVNPLVGIKFNPRDYIDVHLSLSQKSRFPTMRNLYSVQGGNPDLRDERGSNLELGVTYDREIRLGGAVFMNWVDDLIDRVYLPDDTYIYANYKEVRIRGFELEAQKSFNWLSLSANYTYLHARNVSEDRVMDGVPTSQFNMLASVAPRRLFRFSLWALAVSSTTYKGSKSTVTVPGYVILNGNLEKEIGKVKVFLKLDNLLNKEYTPEPGFPMRGRTVYAGVKASIGGK